MLQRRPGGWEEAFVDFVGVDRATALLADMFEAEKPAIRGDADVIDIVAAVLDRYDADADPEHVYDVVWRRIEMPEPSRELVKELRASGLGVHLGTNQTQQRAAYMREELGYDELFDVSCYSAEMGVSKPEAAYFRIAVERIGARADEVLFVDDTLPNVQAADRAGLAAVHWHMSEGIGALRDRLAAHGVVLPGT